MTNLRKKVGLLFGGRSAEHAVSKLSAANILRALDQDRYEVIPVGIGRDGRWLLCEGNSQVEAGTPSLEVPDGATQIALVPGGAGSAVRLARIIHWITRNRPGPPKAWARNFIA